MSSKINIRQFVIDRHMKTRSEAKKGKSHDCIEQTAEAWREEPNSHLPLVELVDENKISLSEALFKGIYVHKGKFLLCRSVAPSFVRDANLHLIVDDPEGQQVLPLVLANFTYSLSMSDVPSTTGSLSKISIPVGAVIALMNPFCNEPEGLPPGFVALVCKNPLHFVILGKHHPLLSNEEIIWKADLPYSSEVNNSLYDDLEAKDAGVKYFNAKNYRMAYECFTKAIRMSDAESLARQYANRSITCLHLRKFDLALEDAERGLEVDSKNAKLIYRKAKSLFLMKRFEDCLEFLKTCESEIRDLDEIRNLLVEVQVSCQESKTGKYAWLNIAKEAETNPFLEGHAEYFADHLLEIREGAEHGIFAKEDIAPGTLVIANKAFAFTVPEVVPSPSTMQRFTWAGEQGAIKMINAKLATNPLAMKELKCLSCDAEFPGVPECVNQDKSSFEEAFRIQRTADYHILMSLDATSCKFKGSGLWILPKFINHTCVDINVIRQYMGNFQFIRAVRQINKGQQLGYSFVGFADIENSEQRMESILGNLGTECRCRLCEADRADSRSKQKKATKIFEKYKLLERMGQFTSTDVKKLLGEAEAIRLDKSLNVLATRIRAALGFALRREGRLNEAAQSLEEAMTQYESLGLISNAFNVSQMVSSWHPDPQKAAWFNDKVKNYLKIILGDERILTM